MKPTHTYYEIKMHKAVSHKEHNTTKQKSDHNILPKFLPKLLLLSLCTSLSCPTVNPNPILLLPHVGKPYLIQWCTLCDKFKGTYWLSRNYERYKYYRHVYHSS